MAEICAKRNFWPDLMGTDIHSGNKNGPVYDLSSVMTKFLHLGMPIPEIIRSVTSTPARAYNIADIVGALDVGKEADITVLRLDDCDVNLEDTSGQTRNLKQKFVPVAVWKAGKQFPVTQADKCPSRLSRERMLQEHHDPQLIIKDFQ